MHNRGVGLNRVAAATLAVVAVIVVMVGGLGGSASAQTGYPGPTTTSPPEPTEEHQNAGQVRPGETIVIENCGFEPRATTTVTLNEEAVGYAIAGSDGCALVHFTVSEDDCPTVVVNGHRRAARRGRNDVVVAGTGTNTAARRVITGVTVSCSSGGGAETRSAEGGLVTAAGSQRSDRSRATTAEAAATDAAASVGTADPGVVASTEVGGTSGVAGKTFGSVLAATGTGTGRLAVVATVLVIAGVTLVVSDQRRRRRRASF